MTFDGPDLAEVAAALGMTAADFIAAHNATPLRVLATGFAPGFVYCGLHPDELRGAASQRGSADCARRQRAVCGRADRNRGDRDADRLARDRSDRF